MVLYAYLTWTDETRHGDVPYQADVDEFDMYLLAYNLGLFLP